MVDAPSMLFRAFYALPDTITDKDGDAASATQNIGQNLVFKDDTATITANATTATLTVDETDLSINASASFDASTAFTSSYGADGAGTTTYALAVTAGASGLVDTASNEAVDLSVAARGDLETGAHHTAEDVGIVLGQALDSALGDRVGITRYGHAVVPMDEARASCTIDISGRPFLAFDPGALAPGVTGGFDHELTEEFFRAVANGSRLTLHVTVEAGTNAHHMMEAAFKAFARALRAAVAIDPTERGVPSTKGTLTA